MADALRLAVFNFELIDSSLEGEMLGARADEQRRLAMISDQLSQLLIDRAAIRSSTSRPLPTLSPGRGYSAVATAVRSTSPSHWALA